MPDVDEETDVFLMIYRCFTILLATILFIPHTSSAGSIDELKRPNLKQNMALQKLKDDIAKGRRSKSLDLRASGTGKIAILPDNEEKHEGLFIKRNPVERHFQAHVFKHQKAQNNSLWDMQPGKVISYDEYMDMGGFRDQFIADQLEELAAKENLETNYDYYKERNQDPERAALIKNNTNVDQIRREIKKRRADMIRAHKKRVSEKKRQKQTGQKEEKPAIDWRGE